MIQKGALSERGFANVLADGECLCGEIDEGDRPCLTCEAKAFLEDDFVGELNAHGEHFE